MAWDHLSITKPHLVYIILGGFTSLFMLCSSIIKERMYIGEATVATLCGIIFGPHAANLIDPNSWGSVDVITLEFSRVVLVVQCFAVGVELPKFYMEKHWKSVSFLLIPVMTVGWLVTAGWLRLLIPALNFLECLVVAACVTATDPVLASSVVGKGKFAKRVPKHLRDLLSAESGCNDGMAFPFIYLSLYLIQLHQSAKEVSFHWIVITILYECVFGAIFGFAIGYFARHGIKYAERHDMIDRESFLVFYFVLALFCAGSGSILGVDDLLVGFACGVGFSNDGWFTQKTEESHVSNVIDLLLNLAYFVYFGTIIPWEMFSMEVLGLSVWRLVVLAIVVILFRRIPIMLALKPFIPDIKTWREALFAGHFGPIGVGAIFIAILARAELETEHTIPLAELPKFGDEHSEHLLLLTAVWPITAFLVVSSIIVHGSSIAVFTLGKHLNTLNLTISYTAGPEDGPSWMNRLPRIASQSRSQARTMSDTEGEEMKMPAYPPGTLPPVGLPGNFLRRVKNDENGEKTGNKAPSISGRRRKHKKWDDGIGPGGPITQSAIFPQRRANTDPLAPTSGRTMAEQPSDQRDSLEVSPAESERLRVHAETEKAKQSTEDSTPEGSSPAQPASPVLDPDARHDIEVYNEGHNLVFENRDGDVLDVRHIPGGDGADDAKTSSTNPQPNPQTSGWSYNALRQRVANWREEETQKRKGKEPKTRKGEPAMAFQIGNTIIVENEDGEVVKTYELPSQNPDSDIVSQSLKYIGMGGLKKNGEKSNATTSPPSESQASGSSPRPGVPSWASGVIRRATMDAQKRNKSVVEEQEEEDDRHIRFTIGGVGRRMTKDNFIQEMQKLAPAARREIVDQSTASSRVKTLAKQEPPMRTAEKPQQGEKTQGDEPPSAQAEWQGSHNVNYGQGAGSSGETSGSSSRSVSPGGGKAVSLEPSSRDAPESAAERRRRLAALKGIGGEDDAGETAAERRRREAALSSSGAESDSEDDDTPRVPPPKRGIRFAADPQKNKD